MSNYNELNIDRYLNRAKIYHQNHHKNYYKLIFIRMNLSGCNKLEFLFKKNF